MHCFLQPSSLTSQWELSHDKHYFGEPVQQHTHPAGMNRQAHPSNHVAPAAAALARSCPWHLSSQPSGHLHLDFSHVLPFPLEAVLPSASSLLRPIAATVAILLPLLPPLLRLLLLPVLLQVARAVAFRPVQLQVGVAASEAGARLAPAKQRLEVAFVQLLQQWEPAA